MKSFFKYAVLAVGAFLLWLLLVDASPVTQLAVVGAIAFYWNLHIQEVQRVKDREWMEAAIERLNDRIADLEGWHEHEQRRLSPDSFGPFNP